MRRPRIVLEADAFQSQVVRGMRSNLDPDLEPDPDPDPDLYNASPRMCLEKKKMIILRKGADGKGADHDGVGEIRPPPLEAYIVLRPHRVPKIEKIGVVGKREVGVGWDDGVPGDIPAFEKWYVCQHP